MPPLHRKTTLHRLKNLYRDGITHIVLEPLDFIVRLAALVPPPRARLARYQGEFARMRRCAFW